MITHKIHHIIALLIITCSTFSSCVREELEIVPTAEGNVSFKLVTKEDKVVQTKSNAHESSINDVYLIVLDATATPYTFIECKPATHLTGNQYIASLTPRDANVQVWAVANVASLVKAKMSKWVAKTTIGSDIANDLLTNELSQSNGGVIAMPELPPFFAKQDLAKIEKTMSINPFTMERATAKITMNVSGEALDAGFSIIGANMYNAPLQGYVCPGNTGGTSIARTNYMGKNESGTYTPDQMIAEATNTDPLYCYETLLSTDATKHPYLILNSSQGYYRVNLIDAAGEQIALQRNYHYKINIAKVVTNGAKTAEEAVNNPPLNADIFIKDPDSYEIISDGVDYMGLSNSELIIYDSYANNEFNYNAEENEYGHYEVSNGYVATVLTYKSRTPVKITGTECTTESGSSAKIRFRNTEVNLWETYPKGSKWGEIMDELELPETTEVVEGRNIVINLPHDFTSGKIKIAIGSLQKEISITRNNIVSLVGDVLDMGTGFSMAKIDFEQTFIPGTYHSLGGNVPDITKVGIEPADLIQFTTSRDGSGGAKTVSLQAADHLYVKVNPVDGDVNTIYKSVPMAFWGASEFSMTRASNQARVKVHLLREPFMDGLTDNLRVGSQLENYLSAYWRNTEMGERIIKVPKMYSPQYWTARVLYGQDFIRLAHFDGRTSDQIEAGSAEDYRPDSSWKPYLQQPFTIAEAYGNNIFSAGQFRIGLTSENKLGKPRYGLVAFMFPNASGMSGMGQTFLIYVRQGEDADYVFSPDEEYKGSKRSKAQAFSPYYLSVDNIADHPGGLNFVDHKSMNGRGTFAKYPTQQGYCYQWGNDIAIHPSNPANNIKIVGYTYDYSVHYKEICPIGYTLATADEANLTFTHSLQSATIKRSMTGMCADGYYDRLAFKSKGAVTVGSGAEEANIGEVYYNPATMASLFVPRASFRPNGFTSIERKGICFWGNVTSPTDVNKQSIIGPITWDITTIQDRQGAFPVRCVKIVP